MASAPVEYTIGKHQMPNVERAVHLHCRYHKGPTI